GLRDGGRLELSQVEVTTGSRRAEHGPLTVGSHQQGDAAGLKPGVALYPADVDARCDKVPERDVGERIGADARGDGRLVAEPGKDRRDRSARASWFEGRADRADLGAGIRELLDEV